MALHGRVPGLRNAHVVPGRDLAGLGLPSAAQLHRSRRLFPESGVRAAFIRGSRPFSASPARAEVRFGSCQPAGLRRVSFPGALFAARPSGMATVGRAVYRIQHGLAQRGRLPCDLSDLPDRSRRHRKFRGAIVRIGQFADRAAGSRHLLRLHGSQHSGFVRRASRPVRRGLL